ncbi:Gal83p [Sugiyamaella lignohabitans]|uniref:Gal83p n=1 Tax=Sugiyamaella lignohabitans TaxID=796027 RepID=A0A161HLX8_9ASCO|nr:Gal83p [Sugiyamaella lignohabitans]ANB14517.1 Gal83p [Sugiyamaella lignohabitans]
MGNSSSQEDDAANKQQQQQHQQQQHHRHHFHHSHHKGSNTSTPSHDQEEFPPVPPQGFDQIPIAGVGVTATTSVSKEQATVSPPGGTSGNTGSLNQHQRSSSFHHEEFASASHEENVRQVPATATTPSSATTAQPPAASAGVGGSNKPVVQPLQSYDANSTNSNDGAKRPPLRRKSTLLLDEPAEMDEEEMELSKLKLTNELKPLSRAGSGEEVVLTNQDDYQGNVFSTVIDWKQGGNKVYVTGTFTGWRKMIRLSKVSEEQLQNQKAHADASGDNQQPPLASTPPTISKDLFSVVLKLPKGTHRLRFVVDNELRCSDFLPTATDSMGNLVNYIEVGVEEDRPVQSQSQAVAGGIGGDDEGDGEYEKFNEDDEMLREPVLQYGNEIPSVFTDPEVMDQFVSSDFVTPPQLPPHLEGVILNSNSTEKDNNSILPIPNHVVLNHLATTSIKHNVLAVASISRYSRKYVTQILYAPL